MTAPRTSVPIRIALIITELDVGGAERCLLRLATGLDRTEFSPLVISLASPPTRDRRLVEQLEAAGIPVEFLRADSKWKLLRARAGLRRVLREFAPDLVQSFLFHANVLAAWSVPRPVPLVFGIRVADPSRARMLVERRAARRASRVVCVSQSVGRFVAERAGFKAAKIEVIPNGVDVPALATAVPADLTSAGISAERRVLLFVGRLEQQKGWDWLLQLAPEMLARLPGHDLVLVGEGPDRSQIADFQQRHPDLRLHVLGWRADVANLLRRAELLLLPSRWEGMPNVVLEAMAAGRAVLATDVEGVAEVLGEDAVEQRVPFGNDQAWLERLERLAADEGLRERLGRDNQRRAADHFSWPQMLDRYQTLYRTLHLKPEA